jgi:beta-lactam-binding protein with PASTA domain
MSTFSTKDGQSVADGDTVTLTLSKGSSEARPDTLTGESRADYSERSITGTVRSFEQDGETRWEISTDDPQHPAIGFLPGNALTKTG